MHTQLNTLAEYYTRRFRHFVVKQLLVSLVAVLPGTGLLHAQETPPCSSSMMVSAAAGTSSAPTIISADVTSVEVVTDGLGIYCGAPGGNLAMPMDGAVTFYEGGTVIGYGAFGPTYFDDFNRTVTATASLSVVLSAGSHNITVVYAGNESYAGASGWTSFTVVDEGYINPKYMIMGVTYAPPGPNSNVTYSSSNLVGNTTAISDSFTTGFSVLVEITTGVKVLGIGGEITASSLTEYNQTRSSSSSVTISKQTGISYRTAGTGDAFYPVSHDYDIIWLWLNPVLTFTVDPNQNGMTWTGYAYDAHDMNGMDIVGIQVGCLNGHFGPCPSIQNILARTWVTQNEPSLQWPAGDGPGINANDIANILAADLLVNPAYTLPRPLPATTADGRFTQIAYPPNPISYMQAGPGNGGGITTGYNAVYTDTSTVASGLSHTFKEAFGLDVKFGGHLFGIKLTGHVKETNTLSWAHSWQSTLTQTKTLTNAFSITGPGCPQTTPPCVPSYAGPGQFIVYQDNLFGTFMFYPN